MASLRGAGRPLWPIPTPTRACLWTSLNLPAQRDSSPSRLLYAPLGSLSWSSSWVAPSLGQASRERINEDEWQEVNAEEIGELAAGVGEGGNGIVLPFVDRLTSRYRSTPPLRPTAARTLDGT